MLDIPIELGRVSEIANRGVPERYDLEVVRGDSLAIVFRMFREVDECGDGSGAQTLTGISGRTMVRAAPDHAQAYSLDVTVNEDAGNGRVTILADEDDTRIFPETGVWDLELYVTGVYRKTVIHGTWRMLYDHAY